jgi:hypothetical protein
MTLTFDPLTRKIYKGYVQAKTNPYTKFEVPRPKCFLVIDREPFGLQTNRQIDKWKQYLYSPFLWRGAYKIETIRKYSKYKGKYCIPRNVRWYNISRFSQRLQFRGDKLSRICSNREFS